MTARIIDGKAIAAELRGKIAAEVARLKDGYRPGLAVVLVGANAASEVYVRSKSKAVTEAGMIFIPSVGGKSHRTDETSDPRAIERGANVLLHTLLTLAA